MANNTKLSSWTTLRDYLARNIDPNKDWDNEDLRGYDVLNQAYTSGKLSADQFAEGKTALGQYLADVDADRNYRAATAKAENDARVETAQQDYLHTRLAGYLPQLQAGAGQTGYQGLTGGQAVALRNDMAQKQADIGARKQTALGGYLQTYQDALRENSASATDQYTSIAAARETKARENDSDARTFIDRYLYGDDYTEGTVDSSGNIEPEKYTALMEYLKKAGASEDVINQVGLLLDGKVSTPEQQELSAQETTDNLKKRSATITDRGTLKILRANNESEEGRSDEDKAEIEANIDKQERVALKSSLKSGSIYGTGSFTLKIDNGDGYFKNDDVTVTVAGTPNYIDEANNLEKGQMFLYNGKVYVKGDGGKSFSVVDYVGKGAFERMKDFLQDTVYDLSRTKVSSSTQTTAGEGATAGASAGVTTAVETEDTKVSTRKSGAISGGSTFTLALSTKDNSFVNNDVTVTVGGKVSIAKASNLAEGQMFLYNGEPYVKGKDGKSFKVRNYAGDGAYEKIQKYLKGTKYDL